MPYDVFGILLCLDDSDETHTDVRLDESSGAERGHHQRRMQSHGSNGCTEAHWHVGNDRDAARCAACGRDCQGRDVSYGGHGDGDVGSDKGLTWETCSKSHAADVRTVALPDVLKSILRDGTGWCVPGSA